MGAELRLEIFRHRLEGINLAQGQIAADGLRFGGLVVSGLIIIQIAMRGGSHDDVVPLSGRFYSATDPIHNCRVLSETALADFAPTNESAAMSVETLFYTPDEITFKLMLILETFQRLAGLTLRTFFPVRRRHLVAANMDILAREKLANLREHVV